MTSLASLPVEIKEHITRCIVSNKATATDPWLFERELDSNTRSSLLNLAKVGNHAFTELALKHLYANTIFKFTKANRSERTITKLCGQLLAIGSSTERPHLRYCDYVHHIGRCDPPLQAYITKWCRRLLSTPPAKIPSQDSTPRLVIPATWDFVWRNHADHCITSKTKVCLH